MLDISRSEYYQYAAAVLVQVLCLASSDCRQTLSSHWLTATARQSWPSVPSDCLSAPHQVRGPGRPAGGEREEEKLINITQTPISYFPSTLRSIWQDLDSLYFFTFWHPLLHPWSSTLLARNPTWSTQMKCVVFSQGKVDMTFLNSSSALIYWTLGLLLFFSEEKKKKWNSFKSNRHFYRLPVFRNVKHFNFPVD